MSIRALSGWRTTLRIAWRDALRSKGRTVLVVALIGLPVFALSVADVVYRTYQLDPTERIARELGSAQAEVQFSGGGVVKQGPAAWLGDGVESSSDGAALAPGQSPPSADAATVLAALPAGSRLVVTLSSGIDVKTAAGLEQTEARGVDYADPALRGLVRQVSGRAPRADNEVALTTRLSASTGLGLGAELETPDTKQSYRVVGIVADTAHNHAETAYFLPSSLPGSSGSPIDTSTAEWYVASPAPINWAAVRKLNQAGYVVLSRSVYLNPPPKSEIPSLPSYSTSSRSETATAVGLVVGMALLEIVLLAGPAFAVGARRQRRDLALIAAAGGSRRHLRNVVLSNGVVLGLLAGVVGVAGAVGAVAIGLPLLRNWPDQTPGHFDVRGFELLGLAFVALVTGLLAAVFPARAAARTDVTAVLAGRQGTLRTSKRVVVFGLILAGLGIVLALGGFTATTSTVVILSGVALTELGLICCTPALLGLAARLGRVLPLSPRIALRDAGRNRSSAAPAVAAVMASMIGAVAVAVAVASHEDQNRRTYQPSLPNDYAYASTQFYNSQGQPVTTSPDRLEAALRSSLPATGAAQLTGLVDPCEAFYATISDPTGPQSCTTVSVDLDVASPGMNPTLGSPYFPRVLVDDGSAVNVVFGTAVPEAAAALAAGKVVVTDPAYLHDGTVTVRTRTQTLSTVRTGLPSDPQEKTVDVPAVLVQQGFRADIQILPPALAARIGAVTRVVGVLVAEDRAPTDQQAQRARGEVSQLVAAGADLQIETGYHDSRLWLLYGLVGVAAVIAIGSALIATALANVDSRSDLVTLGAIGASPRTRRLLSASRSGVIAGVGSLLGSVAGVIAAEAWIRATNAQSVRSSSSVSVGTTSYTGAQRSVSDALHLVLPWAPLLLAAVGVPAVAALVAGAFTRSRLPSEQRAA